MAHTAKLVQDFLATNCSKFLATNCSEFTDQNSRDHNPLDYHVWAMLEHYKTFHPKPKNIKELKHALQIIWDQLPQVSINKAIVNFTKRI